MQSFSTRGLDPRRRLAYWNELAGASLVPLVAAPVDPESFHGAIERARIGELSFTEAWSEAQRVQHTRAHVSRTPAGNWFLLVQLAGRACTRQGGQEATLEPGDFTLLDTSRPYETDLPGANRMLVIGIPEARLRRQVPCAEALVALRMPGSGVGALLTRFLRRFWLQCRADLEPQAAARVSSAFLELLGAAYADHPAALPAISGAAAAHRIRILDHIEANLHDPQLTPTAVAAACCITPRYLHHLFAGSEETVGRYILRRRLEDSARALSLPGSRRTVTAIALDHGFESPTHFGRAFRRRYGMSPREYRAASATPAGRA